MNKPTAAITIALTIALPGGGTPTPISAPAPAAVAVTIHTAQPTPTHTRTNTTPNNPTPPPRQRNTPPPQHVVYIGDSYTDTHYTALTGSTGWAELLSTQENWQPTNLAHGGTGYTTPYADPDGIAQCAPRCPPFNEEITAATAANPDIIIVLGGRNELGQETTQAWQDGVASFYTNLRAANPNTLILALSPIWDDDPTPPGITTMQQIVRAAAEAAGAHYIDLHNPFTGHPELIYTDGIHPNQAGHIALKEAFTNNTNPTWWNSTRIPWPIGPQP